jgi:hypothetical protein
MKVELKSSREAKESHTTSSGREYWKLKQQTSAGIITTGKNNKRKERGREKKSYELFSQ